MDRPKWVGELIAVAPDAVGASGTIASYRGA